MPPEMGAKPASCSCLARQIQLCETVPLLVFFTPDCGSGFDGFIRFLAGDGPSSKKLLASLISWTQRLESNMASTSGGRPHSMAQKSVPNAEGQNAGFVSEAHEKHLHRSDRSGILWSGSSAMVLACRLLLQVLGRASRRQPSNFQATSTWESTSSREKGTNPRNRGHQPTNW